MNSPFAPKRYELDGEHVYYLETEAFHKLEGTLPTFLVGSRGTGKTTLLKALDWEERLYNSRLREQLPGKPFNDKYIGVYFKLPMLHLELLDGWLAGVTDYEFGQVFSCYLDACWLEALAPALDTLELRREITLGRDATDEVFNYLAEACRHSSLLEASLSPMPSSIAAALKRFHDLRRLIDKSARRRVPVAEVLEALPLDSIGDLGRDLGKLCCLAIAGPDGAGGWTVKVCMDEGDALSLRQQRAVNTMVRLAEHPVGYVVAYASRPADVTTTFIPNQSLQIADRQIILRDEMSDAEFKALAEGVINVRLDALGKAPKFELDEVLGPLDVNGLLKTIATRSEGGLGAELIAAGERLGQNTLGSPLIYEAYLHERLGLPILEGSKAARKQASEQMRKKMVGTYLTLCSQLRRRPLYASADMVLQLSDNCIRDFLRQIERIHEESRMSIDDFIGSRGISIATQDRGIVAAADSKAALVSEKILNRPGEANQLVVGLGELTRMLQVEVRNDAAIRTPERGLFIYTVGSSPGAREDELLIREAAAAGYLRMYERGDDTPEDLVFRVHTSLAPHYRFSYRGAYYRTPLRSGAIRALREARTDAELRSVARRLSRGAPLDEERDLFYVAPDEEALPDER